MELLEVPHLEDLSLDGARSDPVHTIEVETDDLGTGGGDGEKELQVLFVEKDVPPEAESPDQTLVTGQFSQPLTHPTAVKEVTV